MLRLLCRDSSNPFSQWHSLINEETSLKGGLCINSPRFKPRVEEGCKSKIYLVLVYSRVSLRGNAGCWKNLADFFLRPGINTRAGMDAPWRGLLFYSGTKRLSFWPWTRSLPRNERSGWQIGVGWDCPPGLIVIRKSQVGWCWDCFVGILRIPSRNDNKR